MEAFVRDEMLGLLNKKCQQKNVQLQDDEKFHFFGIFDTDHSQFRFVAGDKSLIEELVNFVNSKLNDCGSAYFKPGKQRKLLLTTGDVSQLSFGFYFARKEQTLQIAVCQSGSRTNNEEEILEALFHDKLKPLMEKKIYSNVKLNRSITKDLVKIVIDQNKIKAEIVCAFCEEETIHTVQCDSPENSINYYWNTSNFKRHLDLNMKRATEHNDSVDDYTEDDDPLTTLRKIAIAAEEKENEGKNSMKRFRRMKNDTANQKEPQQKVKGTKKSSMKTFGNSHHTIKTEQVDENQKTVPKREVKKVMDSPMKKTCSQNGLLLQQMSLQNLANMKTLKSNFEHRDIMKFCLNDSVINVNVVKIPQNGSCLFGSVAHQLYGLSVDSAEHEQKTNEIRAEVVIHIKKNFDNFFHELKGRVYERSTQTIDPDKIESECRLYLNACLPLTNCFGGSESVRAISEIYELNIITISEEGECYMAVDFKEEYNRTIFLAHRLTVTAHHTKQHNSSRQHYDSVYEIDNGLLFNLYEYLKNKIDFKVEAICNLNNNSIISLNSTCG